MSRSTHVLSALCVAALSATLAHAEDVDSASPGATEVKTEMALHAPLHTYAMVESLRRGGLILFVRHGVTSLDTVDRDEVVLTECSTQRSLSDAGRSLAMEAGKAIVELRVPIGYVFTSAYCRCRQTADLMFGRGLRVADLAVGDGGGVGAGMRLLNVIASLPPTAPNANTVLVGHSSSVEQAYGVVPEEGELLVIAPAREGRGPTLIGHITAAQWSDVVRDYRLYGESLSRLVASALARQPNAVVEPTTSAL